ncbi:unnamed protein product [Arctia plantaginis]|uniref:Crossover junction endonuclease EME1 n=1 Tax=Arctia plantaginis TaxID=874455 RepID=A0A8S1AGX2_ARCPL|nr:unnamed protein product [Arctia plantaginis]
MSNKIINLSDDDSSSADDLPAITENGSKKKTNAATAKEVKKQNVTEEKAAKKKKNEMNKIYKPGECMKYITVEGHPTLWSNWWCADVSREVTAAGARVISAPKLIHNSLVMWTRTIPRTLDQENGQVKLSPVTEPCGRALYVSSVEDVAEQVSGRTLTEHVGQIRQLVDCALTLVLFGVKDFFKSPRRKTLNSNRTPITEIDLELAIADLLVTLQCDTAIVNTPNELALLIVQLTKAIAEAPHKLSTRAWEDQAQFYMKGESKNCIAMDKDGIAVGKLWQQIIAVLPHSSLETSRALCAKYRTPLELFEALQSSESVAEIADIGVSRAAVPGSKARRVGPEFARKLKILFTAEDGNAIVD